MRLGTRGSKLALAQAVAVKGLLEQATPGLEVEIVTIRTSGDQGLRERVGAFVGEIQTALLEGKIDCGLHCLKDLPTPPVEGLRLSAYLTREDSRDTLISKGATLAGLKPWATVGTGSLRRTSQLGRIRQDLNFKPLVGNVDTRMRKLMEGEYDAIVLAIAGLSRLDLLDSWNEGPYGSLTVTPLPFGEMLPAPGQAILVLETRTEDAAAISAVMPLHDDATAFAAIAERAFLHEFGGGCSVPVAAFAEIVGSDVKVRGLVTSPDGSQAFDGEASGTAVNGDVVGANLARDLIARGAGEVVKEVLKARAEAIA